MVKINLKNVEAIKNLPSGKYSIEIANVMDKRSEDGEPLITFDHEVIDDVEFNGHHIFKNFSPESEKSLPYLIQYLQALGFSDKEIAAFEDTEQIKKACVGKKLTVTYKESKDYAWGKMSNPKPYEA